MLVGVRRCPCCGSGAAGRAADAALRATLQAALGSDFEVRDRVARGRRAAIFRAHQKSLDRWVAVKVLTPAADGSDADVARARFVHGVLVLAHLDHPHVIELYGTPETGGLCTMLMPFVDESLAAVLLGRGRFAPLEAAQILKQLAEALDHVHAAGMVHRDVKPQHVLLERPDQHVRLIDFSLATVVGEGFGAAVGRREVVGTPAYMSPEQAQGREDLDAASDLYSLGVVGYQLLTGMVPFEGTAQQQVVAHRVRRPRDPAARYPDIPADLSDVVMRCLAKSPQDRWTSAQELADALAHCLPAQHQS
jgi:eukaryotic-like serine/threonine-protein kinase